MKLVLIDLIWSVLERKELRGRAGAGWGLCLEAFWMSWRSGGLEVWRFGGLEVWRFEECRFGGLDDLIGDLGLARWMREGFKGKFRRFFGLRGWV